MEQRKDTAACPLVKKGTIKPIVGESVPLPKLRRFAAFGG